jgi:hypothetical protein
VVESIFLDLAVEKRALGSLWQIAVHSEVIQAPHKSALHTGHIGLIERFDAEQKAGTPRHGRPILLVPAASSWRM